MLHLTHSIYTDLSVDPSDVALIVRTLEEFVRRPGGGVIVVEHLHYIVSNSRIWPVLEGLEHLMHTVERSGSLILLGTDLLTEKEIKDLIDIRIEKVAL